MASYSVTFDDGSSHVYDNVPEGVDQSAVEQRAREDFADKKVSHVQSAGAPEPSQQSPIPGMGTSNPNTDIGQNLLAAGQSAVNLTGEALQSPIGHAAEAYLGYKKIAQPVINQYLANRGGVSNGPSGTTSFTGGTNPAFDQALTRSSLMNRVAPYLETAGKLANKALTPALIAKELYYTSPEERAQLQQMEQNHTTLKDWTKQKLGMGNSGLLQSAPAPQPMAAPVQPQMNQQDKINEAIRLAAAKKALGPIAPGQ